MRILDKKFLEDKIAYHEKQADEYRADLASVSDKVHVLAIASQFFQAVVSGAKKAEVRKLDRQFKVGDFLCLHEVCPIKGNLGDKFRTGKRCVVQVTHILTRDEFPEGLAKGYCVLSMKFIAITH